MLPLPTRSSADPHQSVVVSLSTADRQALESLALSIVGHPALVTVLDILQRAHRAEANGPLGTTVGDVQRFLAPFPPTTRITVEGYPVHFTAHNGAVELHP